MKFYKRLCVNGRQNVLIDILSKWKSTPVADWAFDKASSDDYASNIFLKRDCVACFTYRPSNLDTAKLWITISKGQLIIANITPLLSTKLEMDEYNDIFDDFCDKFVKSLSTRDDIDIIIQEAEPSLADIANEETAEALMKWEGTCNKDNGNLHTLDEERWFDFVITAAKTKSPLTLEDLKKWLIEDCGWYDEDTIDRLLLEYENERRLLEYSMKRKRK